MTKSRDKIDPDTTTESGQGKFSEARRNFLARSGMFTAGLMGSALLGACNDEEVFADDGDGNGGPMCDPSPALSDAAILNFALNLEYLEAEFYLQAATGTGIPESQTGGTGTEGMVSGGGAVNFAAGGSPAFSRIVSDYAREIASEEYQHVLTLRSALGSAAVAEPAIALSQGFKAIFGPEFDYRAGPESFLLAAFVFEDVGVTAYKGAAPLIKSQSTLSVAAGFLAAEAYHAALVRTTLYGHAIATGDQSLFDTVETVSDARDSVDDGLDPNYAADDPSTNKDQGIRPRPIALPDGSNTKGSNIVPLAPPQDNTTAPGAAYGRTPGDVLNIVYITPAQKSMGGFFPNGVNGALQMSSARPT